MRSKLTAVSLLLPTLLGLGASAVLLVDYVRSSPVFCAEGGGCDAVKHSPLAALLGVPTPLVGVLGFAVLGALFLARGRRVRAACAALALVGGVIGLGLIAAQLAMGHVCPYCMVVDTSA